MNVKKKKKEGSINPISGERRSEREDLRRGVSVNFLGEKSLIRKKKEG